MTGRGNGRAGVGVIDAERPPADQAAGSRHPTRWPAEWLLGCLALALCLLFTAVSYAAFNADTLIAPLDDVYIHLQYAKEIGQGHFFQYQPGDPISTGASSLLYPLILGAAWAVGFHGSQLLVFAVGFGGLCLALTTVLVGKLGRLLVSPAAGIWAALLVAVNGALLWGASSGMEVGLVALLVTGSLYAFVRETPRDRYLVTPLVAAVAALARPEALIVAALLCAAMVWNLAGAVRAKRIAAAAGIGRGAVCLVPLVAGAGQLAFNYAATGTVSANGVVAKSFLYAPQFYPEEVLYLTLGNVRGFISTFSGISTQDFVFPGALVLFVLGLGCLALEGRQWRSLAVALGLSFGLVVLGVSTLMTAQWQNLRYVQPFLPLFLLLVVAGVYGLTRAVGDARTRRLVSHGLLATALLFSLSVLPSWMLRLGQEAGTIREAPVSIAFWLRDHLPPGSTVAVNDVGAVAYFSGHRTVDLVGLTTDSLARVTANGPGSLYEALREMPAQQRPAYFSIYDNWLGPPVHDLVGAGVLGAQPLISFDLKAPAHPDGRADPPCQSARTCNRVSVYQADWRLAGTGDRLAAPVRGVLRDYLNVGSLRSEADHDYQVQSAQVGVQPYSTVRMERPAGRTPVVDSGRRIIGGETLTARNLVPGRPLTVTARTGAAPGDQHGAHGVQVRVGGRDLGFWPFVPEPGSVNWRETTFTIPGDLVTGPTMRIQLAAPHGLLSPYPDYLSYGYWFSQ